MAKVLPRRSGSIAFRWQNQRSHLRPGRAAYRFISAIARFSCNRTGARATYGRRSWCQRNSTLAFGCGDVAGLFSLRSQINIAPSRR